MKEDPHEIVAIVNKGDIKYLRSEVFSIFLLPAKSLGPCYRALVEKLTLAQVDNKFSAFYGNLRSITMFSKPVTDQAPRPYGCSPHCQNLFLFTITGFLDFVHCPVF
jgi:hypothetical protein